MYTKNAKGSKQTYMYFYHPSLNNKLTRYVSIASKIGFNETRKEALSMIIIMSMKCVNAYNRKCNYDICKTWNQFD